MPFHPQTKAKYPLRVFFTDVWHYTQGHHRRLLFWYFVFTLTSLAGLLPPIISAKIIDDLATSVSYRFSYLLGLLFFIQFFRIVVRNRSKFKIYQLAEAVRLKTRQSWISQVLNFDLKWHDQQNSGKKISIISRGSEQVRSLVQFVTKGGGVIDILVNTVAIIIIFCTINPKYALLGLVNITFYLIALIVLNKQLYSKRHDLNRTSDLVMGKNFDFFSNMSLIKSLGIGQTINHVLFKKETKLTQKAISVNDLAFKKWIYINSISEICYFTALFLIISDIINHQITVGAFFIYTGYINRLQDALSSIADCADDIIEKHLGLYRLRQLLNSGYQFTATGHQKFPDHLSSITVSHLYFAYKTPHTVLKDINLELVAGQKYGLVGTSGSGKSTLSKLLLKLYLSQKGYIKYNHQKINSLDIESLHQHISVAPQENEIFNLSFKENITIASHHLKFNPRLYHLAIKTAECQSILDKIKNNHQALLGEKGFKLSGGERQRLGIARAIYQDTPIIIFDESTSALDSKTESEILNNLEKYFSSKTIIWIAHRLSTLRFTDQIIVFHQGQVVEQDCFQNLIKKQGYFYQLWQIQKKTKLK